MDSTLGYEAIAAKYPSPRPSDPVYTKYWGIFVAEVACKAKFQRSHLFMLETLCEMYSEKLKVEEMLDVIGYTYDGGEGRGGLSIKTRPEVAVLFRLRGDILAHHKVLGLSNKDPKGAILDPDASESEWK